MTVEIRRRASVVLAALVAAVFGLVAFVAPVASAAELGNIDESEPLSIVVHKHKQPADLGDSADGKPLAEAPADPLQGVVFSAQKVQGIDLSDFAQWDDLEKLTYDAAADKAKIDDASYALGVAVEETTKDDGTATFDGLERGVYLIKELRDTADPSNNITKMADPFFVVVPMPYVVDADEQAGTAAVSEWLYEVHAYPKNAVTKVEKTVDDESAVVADDVVTWPVTTDVPHATKDGEKFETFAVRDSFDPRLTFDSEYTWTDGEASGTGVKVFVDTPSRTVLPESSYTVSKDGQTVTVQLNAEGMDALEAARGGKITVVFPTKVIDYQTDGKTDGVIPNKATSFFDDPNAEDSPKYESDEPDTEWGKVTVKKYDAKSNDPLKDAYFGIFTSEDAANAAVASADINDETTPDSVGAVAIIKTGNDGLASQILKEGEYWIKELKAPEGYVLDKTVKSFTINPVADEGEGAPAVVVEANVDVPNTKQDVPNLPLTGASGQLLMMVGGLAIVLLGAGVGLVAYKRNRA